MIFPTKDYVFWAKICFHNFLKNIEMQVKNNMLRVPLVSSHLAMASLRHRVGYEVLVHGAFIHNLVKPPYEDCFFFFFWMIYGSWILSRKISEAVV